jgi:lipoyl(octanoyl) transferase
VTPRLLKSGFNDGFYNMAIDEALFRSCAEKESPPTLRFYGWNPPAVSLGYFQRVEDFRSIPGISDYDIVKRLTGGGAILHDRELTFSLICKQGDGLLPEDVFLSYEAVCKALSAGLGILGIQAETRGEAFPGNPVSGIERKSPYFCFSKPSRFDVTVSGRKIAGSAQRRRGGALLHHGSIPIEGADDGGSVSVEEAAGRKVSFDELMEAALEGFEKVLGFSFREGRISGFERCLASELACVKYNKGAA